MKRIYLHNQFVTMHYTSLVNIFGDILPIDIIDEISLHLRKLHLKDVNAELLHIMNDPLCTILRCVYGTIHSTLNPFDYIIQRICVFYPQLTIYSKYHEYFSYNVLMCLDENHVLCFLKKKEKSEQLWIGVLYIDDDKATIKKQFGLNMQYDTMTCIIQNLWYQIKRKKITIGYDEVSLIPEIYAEKLIIWFMSLKRLPYMMHDIIQWML